MESTALYWKPVWMALRGHFRLYLAQAQSNRARAGRKMDFADADRLIRRLQSKELVPSFVPEPEQQEWRMLTRKRVEYTQQSTRLRNQIEVLLDEARIKISAYLSDLLSLSSIELLERHREELSGAGPLLRGTPGDGGTFMRDSRHRCFGPEQIIAEVGPSSATFPTAGRIASWAGVCSGRQESAGISRSDACPKGNRSLRRIMAQTAWAAVRTKDSFFQVLFRKLVPRLGVQKAI